MLPKARLFAFFVGVSPRAILFALKAYNERKEVGLSIATPSPSEYLSHGAKVLYFSLLKRLVKRNAALRSLVRDKGSGGANFVSIMDGSVPWERLLVPLSGADVMVAWSASAAKGDPALIMHQLHELADHQLFMLEGAHLENLALWPVTAAQVCGSDVERRGWAKAALPKLKGLLDLVMTVVGVANAVA
jgi:hypothetical protein